MTTETFFTFTDAALDKLLQAIWGRGYLNALEVHGMITNGLLADNTQIALELDMRRSLEVKQMLLQFEQKRESGINLFVGK